VTARHDDNPEPGLPRFYTLAETARTLRKSERWLWDWLKRHPCDDNGQPFFRLAGRTKLFSLDDVMTVFLPPVVVRAFRATPPRIRRPSKATAERALGRGGPGRNQTDAGIAFLARDPNAKLFRFHQSGHLRELLATAMRNAGLSYPPRQGGFHLFCHTYGSWMVRYANLDNFGLTRTGRWKDPRSAEVYVHTEINSEARLAAVLPTPPTRGKFGERGRRPT
jgi:hypothetical protein